MNRKIGFIVALAIILVGFLLGKLMSNQKEPVKRRPTPPSLTNYNFQTVNNQIETFDIELSGTLKSLNSIDLFAEVTGVAHSGNKEFREGRRFKKGDILLKIDDSEYKNNVLAQKSGFLNNLTVMLPDLKLDFPENLEKWQNYLNNFDLTQPLRPLPDITSNKEKYYIASKNIFNQYYNIKSMEARLEKYTIYAPFDGIVTNAMIIPGTLVRAAQNIGTYKNTNIFEMTAFAGIDEVKMLQTGMPVVLTSNDISGEFTGRISRINRAIDKASQKVKVYIIAESDELLDGLYFHATIQIQTNDKVIKLPSESIFSGGSVWLNKEGRFASHKIEIVNRNNGFVLAKGLPEGEKVLLNPDNNMFEGKKVQTAAPQKKDK